MIVAPDKPPDRATPAPALAYDGAGPYATRRGFRLLLTLTLLNTLMLAGFVVGPTIKPFAAEQWEQWQAARAAKRRLQAETAARQTCLTYAPPPGFVVYEEDPIEAAKLLAPGDGKYAPALTTYGTTSRVEARRRRSSGQLVVPFDFKPPALAVTPDALNAFDNRSSGGQDLFGRLSNNEPALLFLHERTTPQGTKRLVVVRLYSGHETGVTDSHTDEGHFQIWTLVKNRRIVASAWDYPAPPATPQLASQWTVLLALPDRNRTRAQVPVTTRPIDASAELVGDDGKETEPSVPTDDGNRLRVYAGQPDPADASHFTIAYQLDGKPGTIDGWAKDAGVVLRPREGAPVAPDASSATAFDEWWDLTAAAPASQPTAPQPSTRRGGGNGTQ